MHRTPTLLALTLAAFTAAPAIARAQTRVEREAFTWEGRIPDGRWITVRNLNGDVDVQYTNGNRVQVVASRRTRRGDPEHVRFEVRKYGPGENDVLICAIWGEESTCDERGYRNRRNDNRGRNRNEVSVEFRVLVPRGVKVGAHSVNGNTSVE